MIILKKNIWKLNNQIYFADRPKFKYGLSSDFLNSSYNKNILGYLKREKYTKMIDLRLSIEKILFGFMKQDQYEVRRAEKDNLFIFNDFREYKVFVSFYNKFASQKGGIKNNYNTRFFERNKDVFYITGCKSGDDILVMHSYILDYQINRATLFHSASIIWDQTKYSRAFLGRANRYLHYQDMINFKNMGFMFYDFGGYAFNTKNSVLQKINDFKDSFGGDLILEYNFRPVLKEYILNLIRK